MAHDPNNRESGIDDVKDVAIAELIKEVSHLKEQLARATSNDASVYASSLSRIGPEDVLEMPLYGRNPRQVKEYILSLHELDNRPRLNTSSVGLCTLCCVCVFVCACVCSLLDHGFFSCTIWVGDASDEFFHSYIVRQRGL
jgi:hypothetical protein